MADNNRLSTILCSDRQFRLKVNYSTFETFYSSKLIYLHIVTLYWQEGKQVDEGGQTTKIL